MQSNNWGNTQQRWIASGFPFSIALMVLMLVTALLAVFAPQFYQSLAFFAPVSLNKPWTLLTYSFLGTPSIFIIFDIGLLYWFGSSLERSWGTKAFALFWIFVSVVSALSLCLGALLLKQPIIALPILPMAGAAFVWAFLNSDERMSFFFLPLRGIHFAPIAVLYIIFNYGPMGIAILPFALLGCLAAFVWLKYGISYRIQNSGDGLLPMSRPVRRAGGRPKLRLVPDNKPLDDRFTLSNLNPLRLWKRRQDRRKFEKLMGGDD